VVLRSEAEAAICSPTLRPTPKAGTASCTPAAGGLSLLFTSMMAAGPAAAIRGSSV
jgi:hypothetical protein